MFDKETMIDSFFDVLYVADSKDIKKILSSMIDEYESDKICENCTYRIESVYSGWSECNKCCSEEIVYGTNDGVISSSFGCNNFEKKEN